MRRGLVQLISACPGFAAATAMALGWIADHAISLPAVAGAADFRLASLFRAATQSAVRAYWPMDHRFVISEGSPPQ
jgi:hypothetical protein